MSLEQHLKFVCLDFVNLHDLQVAGVCTAGLRFDYNIRSEHHFHLETLGNSSYQARCGLYLVGFQEARKPHRAVLIANQAHKRNIPQGAYFSRLP